MATFLAIVQWLLAICTVASTVYFLLTIVAAIRFFGSDPSTNTAKRLPVSVLIPLSGADFQAYENYVSFCRQDYPAFQIIFGVLNESDTSIPVIRKLMQDFPDCDIELCISGRISGKNLKVSNLQNMLEFARYQYIVIVDSDIRVGAD